MRRFYTTKCKMPYPHDLEGYPCKKCNGIVIDKGRAIQIWFGLMLVLLGILIWFE